MNHRKRGRFRASVNSTKDTRLSPFHEGREMVTSSRGSDLGNHLGVQAKREIDWWIVSKENQ